MTNLADVPADRLALAPLNQRLGLPLDAPFVEYGAATHTPEQLSRYAGSYRGGEGTLLVATVDDGRLIVRLAGQEVIARPVGADGVLLPLPSGEGYARFLTKGQEEAWGVAFGSRILPRYEERGF